MLNRIRNEPALITGLIRAVLLCLVAFGFQLSPAQIAAVMLVAEAALSPFTRAVVVPTRKLDPDLLAARTRTQDVPED